MSSPTTPPEPSAESQYEQDVAEAFRDGLRVWADVLERLRRAGD